MFTEAPTVAREFSRSDASRIRSFAPGTVIAKPITMDGRAICIKNPLPPSKDDDLLPPHNDPQSPESTTYFMKSKLIISALAASLLLFGGNVLAAEKADAKTEMQQLFQKIQAKLKDGKKTEKDMADDLKEFDALLARHKGEKTDDVAQILLMKAFLYLQVFDNTEKGLALIKQMKTDFPETTQGKKADEIIAQIQQGAESKKVQSSMVVGNKFPDFTEKDVTGKPLSIAGYNGKVVLVDFWATWCGPCVGELPNVLETYKKHHGNGFEIIGVSLDENQGTLTSFTKGKEMTWQQFFDGKGWQNKLAQKYGITSIPATFLLDGEGKIIAKDLRGPALEAAVAKALAK